MIFEDQYNAVIFFQLEKHTSDHDALNKRFKTPVYERLKAPLYWQASAVLLK